MSAPLDLRTMPTALTPFAVSRFTTAFPKGPALGTEEHTTWGEFLTLLHDRREGAKDGPNFVPATFKPEPDGRVRRLKDNTLTRTAVVLDIETNQKTGEVPPSIAETVERIEQRGWAGVVYTSHSHSQGNTRYRVVLPLSGEIAANLPAPEVIAESLGVDGVLDPSKIVASSLFYLPSAEPGKLGHHQTAVVDGAPVDAEWICGAAGAILAAREAEQERQRAEALEAAIRRQEERARQGLDPTASVIEAVRDRLDLAGVLLRHGYKHMGGVKYLYPGSETGVPGVHILTGRDGVERVFSHHAADPVAAGNLPSWCHAKAIDAVDVAAILDHGGDLTKALRTLAKQFGINNQRPEPERAAPPPHPGCDGPGEDWEPGEGWEMCDGGDLGEMEIAPPALEPAPVELPPPASKPARAKSDGKPTTAAFTSQPVDFLADQSGEAPELRPEHIPDALWGFVADISERMGVDPTSVALGCIVACASVTSDDWRVQPKRFDYQWTESPRLWGAIVGDPSILKSPVLNACTRPIDKMDANARKRHAEAMRGYKLRLKEFKADKTGAVPEPAMPRLDRYLVEGATVEAISETLRDDDEAAQRAPAGKVLSRHDEMSEFFGNLDRYKSGGKGGGDRGAYLRLFNGGPYTIDRIGRGSFSVPNWSACFLGGIQPGPIQKIAKDAAEDGLLQRFLYAVPGAQRPGVDRIPDARAQSRYSDLFPALAGRSPPRTADGAHNQPVVFHADAHQHREEVDTLARGLAQMPDTSARLKAAYGKWPGIFARIALTFHLIEVADAGALGGQPAPLMVISEQTARRAADFMVDIVMPHMLRAEAVMYSTAQTGHARWIAGYILAHGLKRIAVRDVVRAYRDLKSPEAKAELMSVMDSLVSVGWLEPESPADHWKTGTAWIVNPAVHQLFTDRAERERAARSKSREDIAASVEAFQQRRAKREGAGA